MNIDILESVFAEGSFCLLASEGDSISLSGRPKTWQHLFMKLFCVSLMRLFLRPGHLCCHWVRHTRYQDHVVMRSDMCVMNHLVGTQTTFTTVRSKVSACGSITVTRTGTSLLTESWLLKHYTYVLEAGQLIFFFLNLKNLQKTDR